MSICVTPIPCLRDNYAYAVTTEHEVWIVDPSEGPPITDFLGARRLALRGVLLTHHHHDHVGGVADIVEFATRYGEAAPWVAAHRHDKDRIPGLTLAVDVDGDAFAETALEVAGRRVRARWIPGHTLGAVAWWLPDDGAGHVFTGDTLFAAGCGRLFEGTPEQMHRSLQALVGLPGQTKLWFGHEYTASNLRFARVVEPHNAAIGERLHQLAEVTTPTTVALERATNPFARARNGEHLAALRAQKDAFRG
ncbi:MAG: hydroxyacylglutathione hydrolase [Myxococcales bacterium FL481]|nr:MAG: hydroxyacylglutathione hydrolase [Myxococcales bacterium FL481]